MPWAVNLCLPSHSAPGPFAGVSVTHPPTLPAPNLMFCSPYSGEKPTSAPSDDYWPGLYLPHFFCLRVVILRLNLSLGPLPAHNKVPFGWNSFHQLLFSSCCSGLMTTFLTSLPVDIYRARAMVTVYFIWKKSWWSGAVLNPYPVRNNLLLCTWPCQVWQGLWSWSGAWASHPRTALFSAEPP